MNCRPGCFTCAMATPRPELPARSEAEDRLWPAHRDEYLTPPESSPAAAALPRRRRALLVIEEGQDCHDLRRITGRRPPRLNGFSGP